ncbi:MAG TPA: hypothetical protein DDW20_03665 [Firmicutes bacterium]|nr:hypothetical protein [Bacillota bacterium]
MERKYLDNLIKWKNSKNRKRLLVFGARQVGKINQLNIYPLTFDEFLLNYNKNTYDYVKKCYENKKEIDSITHNLLMGIFMNTFL